MTQHNQKPRYTFDSIPELKWQMLQELLRDAPPSLEQVLPRRREGGAIAAVAIGVILALAALCLWGLLYTSR